ncbi:MAG TPA: caspase family protein [Methyloceanibacter sp.]|nr:caspase family protein [Methyloceanibacter sp.]
MAKHLSAFVVSLVLVAGMVLPAHAEKRVALVIGNSAYQHTAPLRNPSNDASDMAEKLRALGFEVIDGTNLSKSEMESRIRTFATKLSGADVGLFFYAGHGMQVDGKNFLAPVDASLKSDADPLRGG